MDLPSSPGVNGKLSVGPFPRTLLAPNPSPASRGSVLLFALEVSAMYSVVLLMAASVGSESADFGRRGACHGCWGCKGCHGCGGCGGCGGCSGYSGCCGSSGCCGYS